MSLIFNVSKIETKFTFKYSEQTTYIKMSVSMSTDNQFQVESEEESKKKSNIVYDENGNINLIASLPEYIEFCRAIERGESWYDIMYPRNQDVTVGNSNKYQTGKKRKQPIDINNISRDIKKPRYN